MKSATTTKYHDIKPTRILFVCLGNICRSPTADGILHHLVELEGLQDIITIDSAGTYGGHAGELPDSRMRQHARKRGYELTHHSRRVISADFNRFDLLIAMDDHNFQDLTYLAPTIEGQKKIRRMTDFCSTMKTDHVPDPYYEGAAGFELVLDILEDACNGILKGIKEGRI
ncbi:MAG: low molecular weight protein-tyrosine-phosphatase [Bacteroidales bacterium]